MLLWLWRRLVATAPIRPLAWEHPYAAEAAQENGKKTKQTNKKKPIKCQVKYLLCEGSVLCSDNK